MGKKSFKKTVVIALGGNALIRKGQEGTIKQQFKNLLTPISQIAGLSEKYKIIITHGNGPQVGSLLLQQESCTIVEQLPLEILVAQTQGQIGYMIESTLDTQLMNLGIKSKPIVSLVSYVVVDEKDPAFKNPSKPIGPIYTKKQAATSSYKLHKTAKGYRRLIVSPRPVAIVEKSEIKKLIDMDFIVICCGGGGIPVIREGRAFCGVDAVIDKDLTSAKLAQEIGADIFIIATDVQGAALNYGTSNETFLSCLTEKDAITYLNDGHFAPGSMGPKIEAAIQFVQNKGKRAAITSINAIASAAEGRSGTQIYRFKKHETL